MLQDRGIHYEEIVLCKDATTVSLRAVTARATVPQVNIGGQHIARRGVLAVYLAQA